MKRVLSLSIVCAMLLSLWGFTANAAGMTVRVGTVTCSAGGSASIPIMLSGNTGFSNLGIEIEYDDTALTLTNVTAGQTGATYTAAQSIATNPYNMSWDSTSNNTFNGTLATLEFDVSASTTGTLPIRVSYYKGRNGDYEDGSDVNYDENFSPLSLTYLNGGVDVYVPPTPTPTPRPTPTPKPILTPTPTSTPTQTPTSNESHNGNISIIDFENNPLKFKAKLQSHEQIKGIAIAAVYDIDGALIAVKCYDAASEVPFSFSDIRDAARVRVFWWDSIGGMTPQAKTKTVSL